MDDLKEVSYVCSGDVSHPTWSGIDGEVMTQCPECGEEGEVVDSEVEEESVDQSSNGEAEGEAGGNVASDEESESVPQVKTAQYTITGLVDIFDEQMNITGQFPIGSVQELPVEVGDKAVEAGNATKVE